MENAYSGDSHVVFRLGRENYALPVSQVSSIIRYVPVTPVPRSPVGVLGVINLRGKVIPLVDLMKRFTGEDFVPASASRILVAEGAAGLVGLVVDSVSDVTALDMDALAPVPEGALAQETEKALVGVIERNGSLVVLLDLDEALSPDDYSAPQTENEGEAHV
jgi:purine-binding chemotaxis protein CheW